MSNVTALPTSASRGASGAPAAACRRTISRGGIGLLPPTAAERAEPGPDRVDNLTDQVVKLHCPFGQSRRRDHVRRRVDQLAGDVRPARDERRAVGDRRELLVAPADHEPLDARAAARAAAPPPPVVAADDGALGQRAHLLLDGERKRRIQRPRDSSAAAAGAHGPRRGRPQPLDVRLERDDRERARSGRGTRSRPDRRPPRRAPERRARTARAPAATATRSAPIASGSAAVTSMTIVGRRFRRLALDV